LFLLVGPFQLYRELKGGESGDDVAVLQAGLVGAGFSIGEDPSGVFGWGTKTALSEMYEGAGYVAPRNDGAAAELRTVENQIAAAEPGSIDSATIQRRDELENQIGSVVRLGEIVMTAELPATVSSVLAVGDTISAATPVARLGAGAVTVQATVPVDSADRFAVGDSGSFADEHGASFDVQVQRVVLPSAGAAALAAGSGAEDATLVMTTSGTPAAGSKGVAKFGGDGNSGAPQLLAPAASVIGRGGGSYLYVLDGDRFQEVEVQVLGSNAGTVAVEPADPGYDLAEGTLVRVGSN
jgi:hypothetical protein